MSYVTKDKKVEGVIEVPKKRSGIKILKDVDFDILASECRICQRLKFNKGDCGGRQGRNLCLVFKESPTAKLREKTLHRH